VLTISPNRLRVIGFAPLVFFVAQVVHYWRFGGLGNLAWMCNVGNLLLALGLFLNHKELIRASAIWTIPGLAIWILYVGLPGGWTSALAHIGGVIVGMLVLSQVRMDRVAWFYAFAWYLFMQLVSRLLTSPEINANVAHHIQTGWEKTFTSYWKFWMVMTAVVAFGLWLIGRALSWMWPTRVSEPGAIATGSRQATDSA
jgi:hypothetical protein